MNIILIRIVCLAVLAFNGYLFRENIMKFDAINSSINLIAIMFGIMTLFVTF